MDVTWLSTASTNQPMNFKIGFYLENGFI